MDAGTYTWASAKSYCLTLAYPSVWRLPTKAELESIVDFGRYNPAIDPTAFPSTPAMSFWSSSAYASGGAWLVDFYYGNSYGTAVGDSGRVRCVR